mgnify:FL=1
MTSKTHRHIYWPSRLDPSFEQCRCGDQRRMPKPPAVYAQPTSVDAAAAIAPKTPRLREMVYRLLRDHGPMTDQAIQDATGLGPQTITPRRIELVREGRVRDTGKRAKTRADRDAIVWEAVTPLDVAKRDLHDIVVRHDFQPGS